MAVTAGGGVGAAADGAALVLARLVVVVVGRWVEENCGMGRIGRSESLTVKAAGGWLEAVAGVPPGWSWLSGCRGDMVGNTGVTLS